MASNDPAPKSSSTSRPAPQKSEKSEKSGIRITPKEIVAAIVVVAAVVFALLNNDKHTVNVFGYQPYTYTWLFFLIMLVIGILVGLLLPFGRSHKGKKK